MFESLTSDGMRFALAHQEESLVARVALSGAEWPTSHVSAAIAACNERGSEEKQGEETSTATLSA